MFDNLGRALYLIRDLRGKSQAEVAREAGIGKSQLSKYEGGRELPKLESLRKVLTVLDVGPLEFFYTMHLLDREREKLDLRRDAKERQLPPLILSGKGLFSEATDEAFHRVLREVLALYRHMFREQLLGVGQEERRNDGGAKARASREAGHLRGAGAGDRPVR